MACCLMARSHYLNQCWLLICEVLWHSSGSNYTASTQAITLYTEFQNHTIKSTASSPRDQWVRIKWMTQMSQGPSTTCISILTSPFTLKPQEPEPRIFPRIITCVAALWWRGSFEEVTPFRTTMFKHLLLSIIFSVELGGLYVKKLSFEEKVNYSGLYSLGSRVPSHIPKWGNVFEKRIFKGHDHWYHTWIWHF